MKLDFMKCIANAIGCKKDNLVLCQGLVEDLKDILANLGDCGDFDSLKKYVVRQEDSVGRDCVNSIVNLIKEEIFRLPEALREQKELFPSSVIGCRSSDWPDGYPINKSVLIEDLRAAVLLCRPTWYFHLWALSAFGIYTNEELGKMSIDLVNREYALACSNATLPTAYASL